MSEELIKHMRDRVAKCRWLASMINHPEGKRTLLEMADEGEADIKKLEAEMAANPVTTMSVFRRKNRYLSRACPTPPWWAG